jgi:DNA repair exonuclease SbcCD ATPase subunit
MEKYEQITSWRKLINEKLQESRTIEYAIETNAKQVKETTTAIENVRKAQEIVQSIAQNIQQKIHNKIASIVTHCLKVVFPEPYTFVIHFEQKRGKTEARLSFERNGKEVDPLSSSGGAPVEVASLALRLSCIMLSHPPLRRVVLLDEPFRFLDDNALINVRELLKELSIRFGFQFIMVTHIDELKVGRIFSL